MLGKILGLDILSENGTILGEDDNRYIFTKEDLKSDTAPQKNICVEFEIKDNNKATNIKMCASCFVEKNHTKLAIATVFLTLIFGCIGTFVSRYLFAKQPFKIVWMPTLLHFCISILLFIPLIGIVFYIIGVLFFTVKNYKAVAGP